MGAASPGKYRVRVHQITDYTIVANAVTEDDLKGTLLRVHEREGMEGLRASLEGQVVQGATAIVGSYGLEVEPA